MIGILNRWRQFGRRYFWPHLLLGMVAATLGLPANFAESRDTATEPNSASAFSRPNVSYFNLTHLAALKDSRRRSPFSNDFWHQHAIRTVIRHLSFAFTPPATIIEAAEASRLHHHQVLLETLNALLTREAAPQRIASTELAPTYFSPSHHTGLWLAQVQGIRAGPMFS
ncbi:MULTISPECIES: secA translation cis-regulator SecM [Dickeya]|uniref:Secretion monitor n=1 Tax=Dickeya oryzae TaxID=1240404 RepID=A0AB39IDZ7_9GAMM|nr:MULTISPECIES: secA translation cis-regulator SecM [Dickeya]MBP2848457.1 secA regulator SecM [Dickeya oryzae]MBP2857315.1 secA regulator SecM [Dickeya oryzae]MCA6993361.1 secA translation cis-regulator SecM [Dickeya oryzae]UUE09364.1 secA translation cis-regulator SecM [Dickeya zeae]